MPKWTITPPYVPSYVHTPAHLPWATLCITPERGASQITTLEYLQFNFEKQFSLLDKLIKKTEIFLIYKEIQMGAVAKSYMYMRKGFQIYEEMRKYLAIYEEAVSHK